MRNCTQNCRIIFQSSCTIYIPPQKCVASQVVQSSRTLLPRQETRVQSLVWEDLGSRKWQPTPMFLLGESHGQRSLVGYSLWSCNELDMTEPACKLLLIVLVSLGHSFSLNQSWKWQPTLVLLPGEVHGQRSLEGYSPWDCRVGHD